MSRSTSAPVYYGFLPLRFRFHLGTRLDPDIHANLALEIRKQPLDKEGIEVFYFKDIIDRRIPGLVF